MFEDEESVHIVAELCTGPSLQQLIDGQGQLSEHDARRAMRAVLQVIAHCHAMGVLYRCVQARGSSRAACPVAPGCVCLSSAGKHNNPGQPKLSPRAGGAGQVPAVSCCSSCAIAASLHRDIKPEHFLLSDSSSAAQLKAIDFGISLFLKPDQLHEVSVSGFL